MTPIKLSGLSVEETAEIVPAGTVLLGYVGSKAHGTYVPKDDPQAIDDIDILGVCVPGIDYYLGLRHFEQKEVKRGEWDSVVYELRKFVRLLVKQNPNVISLLWLQEKDYIHIGPVGKMLLDQRHLFSSKVAYHSFVGYAHGQLHRMTHQKYEGYMGAKRKQLVDKYGFDAKNGSHLLRILRMGIEFLTDGRLQVYRPDAAELKEVKRGEWSLERIQKEADRLFALAQEAFVRSPLPPEPDIDKINDLLVAMVQRGLEPNARP